MKLAMTYRHRRMLLGTLFKINPVNVKNMYACIINIYYVPHEVKYQRALAKRTSQMM